MRDAAWKIGERVLMCLLSRSLDAVCLGKARLSMANGFPQFLHEPFPKTPSRQRPPPLSGCMTGKWSTQPLNNL